MHDDAKKESSKAQHDVKSKQISSSAAKVISFSNYNSMQASKNNLQPRKIAKTTPNDVSRSSTALPSASKPRKQSLTAVKMAPLRENRL